MFEVAFSRRMCCSRVWSVSTKARRPSGSTVSPTIRPGMRRTNSCRAREEAVVRAAVQRRAPGALPFADRHRASVLAGRLEHPERHQVDVGDRVSARHPRPPRPDRVPARGSRRSSAAGRSPRPRRPTPRRARRDRSSPPRCGTSTTSRPKPGAYVFTTWRTCGIQRLGENDLRAVARVLGDEARVGGDRAPVVAGRVRHVHPGQLADDGLVLEDRLQHALAHLRLVRRVRGQELAAREQRRRRPPERSGRRSQRRGTRARRPCARCGPRAPREWRRARARRARAARRARGRSGRPAGSARRARRSTRRRSQRASPRGRRRSG